MTQNTLNDPMPIQESEASSPVPVSSAQAVDETEQPTKGQIVGQTAPCADNAAEQIEDDTSDDDASEEEADSCEDSDEEPSSESASNSNASATAQSASTNAAKNKEDEDERSAIEKQPYEFEHCTVQIAIQLLPDDGDLNGRMVVIGVRSHLDTPILRLVRLNELGALPSVVNELVEALKAELPTREQAARNVFEKKKEEKAKRKAELEASRARASQRGKKTAKANTLTTAPSANATPIDNRPRPEVNVPKTPQQQMGLL
jgi:hypothetical protein